MGEIYAAKTNHITNPVGYALKPLVFSWKVKGCKGQEQRHARIMISKEPTFTTLCFDTGEAALDSRAARVEFESTTLHKILLESPCGNGCRRNDRVRRAVF